MFINIGQMSRDHNQCEWPQTAVNEMICKLLQNHLWMS